MLLSATFVASVAAQDKTPLIQPKIPEKIMTPDKVETRFGALDFVDGVPTKETTQKLYDNLDYIRGVEVFLNFIPASSMEGLRLGAIENGANKSNQAVLFDHLMDSNPLYLTGNTDTVYCMVFLDLQADGPTVLEIPPGTGPARWTTRSSALSSTWARPARTRARAASTLFFRQITRARCQRIRRTAASTSSRSPLRM